MEKYNVLKMKLPLAILSISIGIYMCVSLAYINLPGYYYDEIFWLNAAIGSPVEGLFITKSIKGIPIAVMPYIGALKSWIYSLPLSIFGTSQVTVRTFAVVLGVCALIVNYKMLKKMLNQYWASLGTLLMAIDPAFVFYTRLDYGPVTIMLILKTLTLIEFYKYIEKGKLKYLFSCGFLMFIGCFDKANFSWFMVAFLISAVLVYGKELIDLVKKQLKDTIISYIILGSITLCIGMFYLLPLFKGNGDKIISIQFSKIMNLMKSTFNGTNMHEFIFGYPTAKSTLSPKYFAIFFVISLILSIYCILKKKYIKETKFLVMSIFITLILFACMCITPEVGGGHHVMMLWPAPQLFTITSLFLIFKLACEVKEGINIKIIYSIIAIIICIPFVMTSFITSVSYLDSFRNNDAYNPKWDPKIDQLADYVNTKEYDYLYCADWGIGTQMIALSKVNNRNKLKDMWGTMNDYNEDNKSWLYETFFKDKNTIILAHAYGKECFKNTTINTEKFLNDFGIYVKPKVINGSNGEQLYYIYEINGKAKN